MFFFHPSGGLRQGWALRAILLVFQHSLLTPDPCICHECTKALINHIRISGKPAHTGPWGLDLWGRDTSWHNDVNLRKRKEELTVISIEVVREPMWANHAAQRLGVDREQKRAKTRTLRNTCANWWDLYLPLLGYYTFVQIILACRYKRSANELLNQMFPDHSADIIFYPNSPGDFLNKCQTIKHNKFTFWWIMKKNYGHKWCTALQHHLALSRDYSEYLPSCCGTNCVNVSFYYNIT